MASEYMTRLFLNVKHSEVKFSQATQMLDLMY